jgi:hypothetical protein
MDSKVIFTRPCMYNYFIDGSPYNLFLAGEGGGGGTTAPPVAKPARDRRERAEADEVHRRLRVTSRL